MTSPRNGDFPDNIGLPLIVVAPSLGRILIGYGIAVSIGATPPGPVCRRHLDLIIHRADDEIVRRRRGNHFCRNKESCRNEESNRSKRRGQTHVEYPESVRIQWVPKSKNVLQRKRE